MPFEHPIRRRRLLQSFGAALPVGWAGAPHAAEPGTGRVKLLGMNIGAKNYDEPAYLEAMAKLDVVILGLYPGWRGDRDGSVFRRLVQQLKARNPRIKVGQYTVLNEAPDDRVKSAAERDKIDKIDQENWWLRNPAGAKTQWTEAYKAWDVNISDWAKPDRNGDRYPQWLAKRDARVYFQPVPEFDIWYFDNVMEQSRVTQGDWQGKGVAMPPKEPAVASAFRRAQVAHWTAARALEPSLIQMGNADHDLSMPEYTGQLQAVFIEAIMGKSWSLETWAGWRRMMQRYFGVMPHLKPPKMVGFNVWGKPDDYRFLRYALTSCLLGEGYFSFTDDKAGYSSVPWFDEYEVPLGNVVDAPTLEPWDNGVYRRRFDKAMVLVNPETSPRPVKLDSGWKRFKGRQAPEVNNGEAAREFMLPPRDGLVLVRG